MGDIAVIGAGFSGAMLAVRLAADGHRVRLIEKGPAFGLGVAYSTTHDSHLLNVRSGRMSAVAGEPDHFVRWLEANAPEHAAAEGFAPRRIYGRYVQARLVEAEAAWPDRIERLVGEAVAVTDTGVRLADGREVAADRIVLATGNPPPRAGGRDATVIGDPWAPGALDVVRPSDHVVVLGAGLTMIDVLLMLEDRGWLGRASALSRRGLTPRRHDAQQDHVAAQAPAPGALSDRLMTGRRTARRDGWAVVMDRMRSLNAEVWAALDLDERARFLRHLRPWWDVHRHRVAPGPADRIEALIAGDRLEVCAGYILGVAAVAGGAEVTWRPRGEQTPRTLRADRVIDCTGPGYDPRRASDALTRSLVSSGTGRPDPLNLGLDVAPDGTLIAADGEPSDRVFVLGPPARAAFWECVAVPDIRERIEALARRMAGTAT